MTKANEKLFKKLLENQRQRNNEFLQEIRAELSSGVDSYLLSKEFLEELKQILKDPLWQAHHPLKQYWCDQLERLIALDQIHEELEKVTPEGEDFFELQDELIYIWDASEFATAFLEKTQSGQEIFEASDELISVLENQIIALYYLHFSEEGGSFERPLSYCWIEEWGDSPDAIYLHRGSGPVRLEIPKDAKSRVLNITGVDVSSKTVLFGEGRESTFVEMEPMKGVAASFYFLPNSQTSFENQAETQERIAKAIEVLKAKAPENYHLFLAMTKYLIPIEEDELVSFSQSHLPQFSSINFYNRDNVDLLDDLVHESGHHYLNLLLEEDELMIEDEEKVFFSPWRQAPRPVRGIYHAYCTFFWAFDLFSKLGKEEDLTQEERLKMIKRALEEHSLLKMCWSQIEMAHKLGKVSKEGLDLAKEFKKSIDQWKDMTAFRELLSAPEKEALHTSAIETERKIKEFLEA